jgi:propanol-preferring alcohol dehydrogenase
MKAAVLKEFGQPLSLEEVEAPRPARDEVLIRVQACGTDGTDLKLLEGFGYKPELPFVIGHEVTGIVDECGAEITQFQPGDHVITYNFFICGNCLLCRTHREQLCPNMTGVLGARGKSGGMAEFITMPERQVVKIPDNIPWHDAAVICDAGITAFHAVDRSRTRIGETVLIFGVGGVGSFAVQFAKLAGAKVFAVDQTAAKLEWARKLGAGAVIDSSQVDVAAAVREATAGWGVDCVIDIVGKEATIGAGVNSLRNGGRIVIVGYTADEYPLSGKYMAQNELEVIGSRCGRKQDLINTADMVASGAVRSIVTDRVPFDQVNEAHEKLRAGQVVGRLVLDIG